MKLDLRKVLTFGLQFLPFFALFVWIYLLVLPVYQPVVLGVANAVTERLDPRTHIELTDKDGWQLYRVYPHGAKRKVKHWTDAVPPLIFLSLAMLPALLLATPIPFTKRLRLAGLGLLLLFPIHVFSIIGVMRGVLCLHAEKGTFHCLWLLRISYTSGQLFSAVLWGLLTWRYWLPGPQKPPS